MKLTDAFGFVDSIEINPLSALTKYFKPLPDFSLADLNLKKLGNTQLSKVASLQAAIDLGKQVQIGTSDAVDLEVKPTAGASLAVFSPTAEKCVVMFDSDQYADPIPVGPNQRYVSLTFDACVQLNADKKLSDLNFGFNGGSSIKLAYYQLFNVDSKSPTLAEALHSTIASYAIPGDLDDVKAMPAYSIACADGSGNLNFSATVNVASLLNAPVSLPLANLGPVQISAGAKISVGASFELSCEYQVRVQRLDGQLFHLGVYRKRNTDFTVTTSAQGGVSMGLGQNDLFGKILQAISADPKADLAALAGLPDDRVEEIQSVVKQAVERTLNVGVCAELGMASESEAMFLYEIDLGVISSEGRPLVHAALEGNWGPLVATDATPPVGITALKSLVSSAKTLRHMLKVNLLGIYNYARVSELILQGTAAWDAASGELILTDTATASRIGVSALNFAADPKKLRQLLSEQFLLSAAYTASTVIKAPPGLHAQHSFFDSGVRTDRRQLRNDLLLGVGFQMLSEDAALSKLTAGIANFGQSTVLAETCYDDKAAEALFLNNDQPRNAADYERAGRDALTYLVRTGDEDDFRLLIASNDKLWAGMKEIGNVASAAFAELIRSVTPIAAAPSVMGVDFLNIIWWTTAMNSCAQKLADVRSFLKQQPNCDPNNHDFVAKRRQLANDLLGVAATTRQDFGGPWGLLATYLLAARAGSVVATKLLITNQRVNLIQESAQPGNAPFAAEASLKKTAG